jgi:ribonuclease HII
MLESRYSEYHLEAGCDEAGRGCLAGPVAAACVILPFDYSNPLLNDSKKISPRQRSILRQEIELKALAFKVEMIDNHDIDRINILNASILAMHRAIVGLPAKPEFLIIDGNRFTPYPNIPHKCIVKGDSKFLSIAAASILAKTYRDQYMKALSNQYPMYSWHKNMGYPTAEHRMAIERYGITPFHRRSFKLTNKQLDIPFQ